jgi:hypothetical protein
MFVRYYVDMPLPAAQVEPALLTYPAEWLSSMAGAAQEHGDGLLTAVGVGPLGEDRTQLAISARYRPPLGVVGRAVDRVLLHRVAEATLKDFLDRLGRAITDQAITGGAPQVVGHEGDVEAHAP